MTIGCLSDLHNELGLISGELSTVKLRGTFGNTIKRMHEEEDVDLICLGGDYTSDVTVSKENWERVKQLMRENEPLGLPRRADPTPGDLRHGQPRL